MADWNTVQAWEHAYRCKGGFPDKAGFGDILSYLDGRSYASQLADDEQGGLAAYRHRLQKLGATGINPAAETLIVGCGFGWLLEVIVDAGSNAVWGTDISTLIQSLKSDPSVAVRSDIQPLILDIDIRDADAAAQFQAAGAGNNKGEFRNVVTERLLDDWPIADMTTILDACDAIRATGQSQVYHMVTAQDTLPPGSTDPQDVSNLFTIAEWTALRPEHYWVDMVSGNIAGGV